MFWFGLGFFYFFLNSKPILPLPVAARMQVFTVTMVARLWVFMVMLDLKREREGNRTSKNTPKLMLSTVIHLLFLRLLEAFVFFQHVKSCFLTISDSVLIAFLEK